MKEQILRVLSIVGAQVVKVVFSRKFIALVGVALLGLKALEMCLLSENPLAIAFFGVIALLLLVSSTAYMITNVKAKG